MARPYDQHCSLAHALDLVGERWTLLIVRELLAGPRRYSDLAAGLVTVPTNMLASRLKQLESSGLIRQRRMSPPAQAVVVYELTELGEDLGASVVELARWGMRTLPATRDGRPFQSHWLVVALRARFEPQAAAGVEESYEFRIDGDDTLHFEVSGGEGAAGVGPASDPAVVVAADTDTFLELSAGAITPVEAIERGARIEGDAAAIERMSSILPPRGTAMVAAPA
jgi:DNA-binding HxlR family transcriptional regulator/putative sterol carrier protein